MPVCDSFIQLILTGRRSGEELRNAVQLDTPLQSLQTLIAFIPPRSERGSSTLCQKYVVQRAGVRFGGRARVYACCSTLDPAARSTQEALFESIHWGSN